MWSRGTRADGVGQQISGLRCRVDRRNGGEGDRGVERRAKQRDAGHKSLVVIDARESSSTLPQIDVTQKDHPEASSRPLRVIWLIPRSPEAGAAAKKEKPN